MLCKTYVVKIIQICTTTRYFTYLKNVEKMCEMNFKAEAKIKSNVFL